MAQRRRGLGAGAAVGVVVALGLLAWMFTGGEPQVDKSRDSASASEEGVAKKSKKKSKKKKKKSSGERIAVSGPFGSRDECLKSIEGRKQRAATAPLRLGSWNVRWFPRGGVSEREKRPTDLEWLACAIASLEVDVLAMQEILQDEAGRAALLEVQGKLDTMTGGSWKSDFDDCEGDGRQHVGLLYDSSRVQVSDLREVPGLNPKGEACASNLRPGFGARVKLAGGPDVQVVAVHLDSGEATRDYDNRVKTAAALGAVTAAAKRGQGVVVLGDFNTMGCKECTPPVSHKEELAALDTAAEGAGLKRLQPAEGKVCSHYFGGKSTWLDHVLVSKGKVDLAATARMESAGACAALKCKGLKSGRPRPLALNKLSDHCPVVVELGVADAAAVAKDAPAAAPKPGAAPAAAKTAAAPPAPKAAAPATPKTTAPAAAKTAAPAAATP
jgi:endonuclease/exonuclease/phosphatase family metal-dependent hydrolase